MSINNFFKFGQLLINPGYHLYSKGQIFAFLAPIPVVQGLCPKHEISCLMELETSTLKELTTAIKMLTGFIQNVTNTTSTTVTIQEGEQAGQKIKHLHAHLIPRYFGDFQNNDDIYPAIDSFDEKLINNSCEEPYIDQSIIELAQKFRVQLQAIVENEDDLKKYGLL